MQVLDYSAGFPSAERIRSAGYGGAVRYIGQPGARKNTTAAELADFNAHGLGMALVFEQTAGNWRGGVAQGKVDGGKARAHAHAIGFPAGRPVYMAIDQDVVTAAEFDVMLDYLRGAAGPLGGVHLTGVYGEHDVCVRAQQAGVARWFWQCRAWSGTPPKLFPDRHLYQNARQDVVGGVTCDLNDVLRPDWGQHNHLEVDDMPYVTVIHGPGKPPRVWVDGSLVGFPDLTELAEYLAPWTKAGYEQRTVTFTEADDWQRYMDGALRVETAVAKVLAALKELPSGAVDLAAIKTAMGDVLSGTEINVTASLDQTGT